MNNDRFDISNEAADTLRHFCAFQSRFGKDLKKRKSFRA